MISRQYMAGFFDGEGCVNLTVKGKHRQVALRVTVINTDPTILIEIQREFGGRLAKPRIVKSHWKAFRKLEFTDRAAVDFLLAIYPFLIIKKRQAKLAMDFWNFQHSENRNTTGYTATGHAFRVRRPETVQKELEYKAIMHELNRKGTVQ